VSKGSRGLTDDEKKLWRRVAANVRARRPLPADDAEAETPLPSRNVAPIRKSAAPPASPPLPTRAKIAPPQDRGAEKRVRRGKLEIGGSLDLHGHNQVTGQAAVERFLRAAQARGDRAVIVITGVGRGGQGGVLKRRLPEWLADRALSDVVNGFAQAHRSHGGEGAFYVFLRRAGTR
jgi:DNA-nicking Smr family endonuclease